MSYKFVIANKFEVQVLPASFFATQVGAENLNAMTATYGAYGLTDTEAEIYVPGFDDRPANGYIQTVLVANEERQPVAELFPKFFLTPR